MLFKCWVTPPSFSRRLEVVSSAEVKEKTFGTEVEPTHLEILYIEIAKVS